MAHRWAGLWGPHTFSDLAGNVDTSITITVRRAGQGSAAVLYADRARAAGLPNPLPTGVATGQPGVDAFGNALAYAEPGLVDVTVDFGAGDARVYRFAVPPDGQETEDERTERTAAVSAEAVLRSSEDDAVLSEAQAYADARVVPLVGRGAYSASSTYVLGDVVTSGGSSYMAKGPIAAGTAPPAEGWQLLASGGDTATLQAQLDSNTARITTAESDIDALQAAPSTTVLEGRITTAESNIGGLDSRLDTAEAGLAGKPSRFSQLLDVVGGWAEAADGDVFVLRSGVLVPESKVAGATTKQRFAFPLTFTAPLAAGRHPLDLVNPWGIDVNVLGVRILADANITTQAMIADLEKNAVSIFSTRPQIAVGSRNSSRQTAVVTPLWGASDTLVAHIDQLGSSATVLGMTIDAQEV